MTAASNGSNGGKRFGVSSVIISALAALTVGLLLAGIPIAQSAATEGDVAALEERVRLLEQQQASTVERLEATISTLQELRVSVEGLRLSVESLARQVSAGSGTFSP